MTEAKTTIDGLRKSVKAGDERLAAQHATMVTPETHTAELDIKDARIMELERQLYESYHKGAAVHEATAEGTAVYVANLKKEVEHLKDMLKKVGCVWRSISVQ